MFYVFHGEDSHSQKETLSSLQAKLGDPAMIDLNTTRFDKPMPLTALRHACDAVPFLAKARLVIVSDLFSAAKLDKQFVSDLVAYLPQLPETTRLVFLESKSLSSKHPVLKLAQQHEQGFAKAFPAISGSSLDKWVRQRVAQKGGRISGQAVQMLVGNIGSQLPILDNEIEKLLMYRGSEGEIEAKDVARLSPYAAEASIFDLVDAVGNRDSRRAAILLHQKLSEGEDPFFLFSMLIRQFRLLIQVKELADAGDRPPAISKQLKMHSFVAGKLHKQCQQFSMAQLEQIYRHLLEIDIGVKTGRKDLNTSLNLLIATLTSSE